MTDSFFMRRSQSELYSGNMKTNAFYLKFSKFYDNIKWTNISL